MSGIDHEGRTDSELSKPSEAEVAPIGPHRYRIHQQLIAFGDDYFIESDAGARVYKVDGKVLRIRKTLWLQDLAGRNLAGIQQRMLSLHKNMAITGPNGETLAEVRKAFVTPLRDRFTVHFQDGIEIEVQGNILDHEYRLDRGGRHIMSVSKQWFHIADTYGIEIAHGENDVLLLAVAIAIDELSHRAK